MLTALSLLQRAVPEYAEGIVLVKEMVLRFYKLFIPILLLYRNKQALGFVESTVTDWYYQIREPGAEYF